MGKRKWMKWTTSCSGCCELGENGSMEHLYPWDDKANCRVGSGCRECGYTGKVRVCYPIDAFDTYEDEVYNDYQQEHLS